MYAGQSLGLIVAHTQSQAINAAKSVRVTYKELQKPVLTIKEALLDPERTKIHAAFGPPNVFDVGNVEGDISDNNQSVFRNTKNLYLYFFSKEGISQSETVVEGEFEIGSQYHMYMETLIAACTPVEDGMDVYCATQDQDAVQNAVAQCLKLPKSR